MLFIMSPVIFTKQWPNIHIKKEKKQFLKGYITDYIMWPRHKYCKLRFIQMLSSINRVHDRPTFIFGNYYIKLFFFLYNAQYFRDKLLLLFKIFELLSCLQYFGSGLLQVPLFCSRNFKWTLYLIVRYLGASCKILYVDDLIIADP